MVDTFWITQIDCCDLMGGKEYSEPSIGIELTNRKSFAAEGLWDFPQTAFEADIGFCAGDASDDFVLVVLHDWQTVRHRPRAGSITICRHVEVQCLVWSIEIVDGAPLVERSLDIGKVPVSPEGEDLSLQCAMEAFVLPPALRMIGPAVNDSNPELEKPHRQPGPTIFKGEAPGTSIIDEHGIGQSVATERRLEMSAHRRALFVGAGSQAQREARVIVQHRQRMAGHAVLQRTMALEVHLPKLIGCLLFESREGLSSCWRRLRDAIVPAQDLVNRRYSRNSVPVALEAMRDLPRSPGRMGIAQCDNPLLNASRGTLRAVMGSPRPVRQRRIARLVPLDPLVGRLGTDPKPPAQLPPVRSLLFRKHYKFSSLIHDRHLSPRHGSPPRSTNPADFDVSTMSPNTRQPCPRAKQIAKQSRFARREWIASSLPLLAMTVTRAAVAVQKLKLTMLTIAGTTAKLFSATR